MTMDDDGEAVLKRIMDDGTFDNLRMKVVAQLKENVSHLFNARSWHVSLIDSLDYISCLLYSRGVHLVFFS